MVIKARKKPVIIECVQWDGTNKKEIEEFCGKECTFELDTHAYDAGVAPPRWNLTIHPRRPRCIRRRSARFPERSGWRRHC